MSSMPWRNSSSRRNNGLAGDLDSTMRATNGRAVPILYRLEATIEGVRCVDTMATGARNVAGEMEGERMPSLTGTAAEVTAVSEIGPCKFTPGEACRALIA